MAMFDIVGWLGFLCGATAMLLGASLVRTRRLVGLRWIVGGLALSLLSLYCLRPIVAGGFSPFVG